MLKVSSKHCSWFRMQVVFWLGDGSHEMFKAGFCLRERRKASCDHLDSGYAAALSPCCQDRWQYSSDVMHSCPRSSVAEGLEASSG